MSRIQRPLLFALLLGFVLALAGAPASAQQPIPFPLRLICGVTVMGAGPTVPDAVANAVNHLKEDYLVLSYTVVGSGCPSAEDLDAPGPIELPVVCWAEVRACAIRKAIILS